ncbi:RNA polymerase sigma-70 factor [Flammeovirga sp. EKP202]|uniref:RNA polymerase sigma-70 factor n=1 Tax=Flammeovirga sp. EKP202 TaxID=2770592 RepID=UPI00165EF847|nr:RNA polymerase sigma-70 factor [Flammeovirga sp. EKP202]MBD0401676.1 RNA polymerase sigma-70 factor [Flammeovirga sp. EKP202]
MKLQLEPFWRSFINDDERAFKEIYEKLNHKLLRVASSILPQADAEDVINLSFIKLWTKRKELPLDINVEAYITKTVKNNSINYYQKNARKNNEQFSHVSLEEHQHPTSNSTEDIVINNEFALILENMIGSMPEMRRKVFTLNRNEGKSYKLIAEELNISVKTVENHMGLAIAQLRKELIKQKYL